MISDEEREMIQNDWRDVERSKFKVQAIHIMLGFLITLSEIIIFGFPCGSYLIIGWVLHKKILKKFIKKEKYKVEFEMSYEGQKQWEAFLKKDKEKHSWLNLFGILNIFKKEQVTEIPKIEKPKSKILDEAVDAYKRMEEISTEEQKKRLKELEAFEEGRRQRQRADQDELKRLHEELDRL